MRATCELFSELAARGSPCSLYLQRDFWESLEMAFDGQALVLISEN